MDKKDLDEIFDFNKNMSEYAEDLAELGDQFSTIIARAISAEDSDNDVALVGDFMEMLLLVKSIITHSDDEASKKMVLEALNNTIEDIRLKASTDKVFNKYKGDKVEA